jgi:hypothetical protein
VRGARTYSSHLPVLMEAVRRTTGAIVELGVGRFSTPVLHWMCSLEQRQLVSYDTSSVFLSEVEDFREPWHDVRLITSWDWAELEQPWGLAFVDHAPGFRRKEDIRRLANWAEVIVVHDTCGRTDASYRFGEVWPLFKWQYQHPVRPRTTAVSNFADVRAWF